MRECTFQSRVTPELPSATHALRTRPRHLARFTALLRNISLNSCCESEASHSSSGENREYDPAVLGHFPVLLLPREHCGWNATSCVTGALRFQGQTSWQISQPMAAAPMAARSSSGIAPRSSIVR